MWSHILWVPGDFFLGNTTVREVDRATSQIVEVKNTLNYLLTYPMEQRPL